MKEEEEEEERGRDAVLVGEGTAKGRGPEVAYVPEIVEEILAQLPISHLYTSCRLVCRKWNDIIQREKVYMYRQ